MKLNNTTTRQWSECDKIHDTIGKNQTLLKQYVNGGR